MQRPSQIKVVVTILRYWHTLEIALLSLSVFVLSILLSTVLLHGVFGVATAIVLGVGMFMLNTYFIKDTWQSIRQVILHRYALRHVEILEASCINVYYDSFCVLKLQDCATHDVCFLPVSKRVYKQYVPGKVCWSIQLSTSEIPVGII